MNDMILATIGGILIGLSATLMLWASGRVAGISGIVGGAIDPRTSGPERAWRLVFLLGLVGGAFPLLVAMPEQFVALERSPLAVAVAGVLVGLGTRLGSGCTSGHGVCGISRLSPRSLVATLTFIFTGAITVFVMRGGWG